jgi:hypothetical protein
VDAPAADLRRTPVEWPTPPIDVADMREDSLATVRQDAKAIVDAALSDQQRAMLEFERRWWRQPGAKEQAIRDTFEMSPTRYYQTLNALLDLPEALTYDAALVHRLQRIRTSAVRGRRIL